ncbi:hypothetical protein BGZ54_000988 [Gamsiella multidivaricata]|nr:hypothetical protein BGZ54_000988 [Gamsiella multidivaricata]
MLAVQNWFARRRTRAAQELQEKKEKQAMLEKLDKSLNSVSDIASEAPIEQRPAPSPHIGLNKEEKESIEAIIGAALFNKLTGAATKIESKVGADIKAESRAGSVTGPLSSSEVGLMISRITRGNSFVKTEDIKTAVELMDAASDYEGRKYIMNALLFTKAQPVLQKFVQLKGPNILRIWMLEAKKDPNTEANKDILLKSIAILKTLPFDFQTLYDSKVGRVMKKLAQDKDIDKEISHQASQLKDKWTYEFTEGSSSVSGSTSDAASISDLPLPKFIKGKPAAPTETSKKSNVVENTGFFRELMRSAPQGSASIPNKSLAIVSLTKPSSPPSLPSSLSIKTQVTTASGSNISPTTAISSTTLSSPKDRSESPVSSDSQPSQLLESSVVKEDADTFKPSTTLEPSDSMNMNNEPAATMPIVKSKKAVRFKADHELVSIQFIEPRGFYSDEEEQFDIDSNNQSYFGDEDTYMQHSVKPPFMMTEQQLEVLLRGDKWQPPLRLQLEPTGQPERGFKSVEKGVQEKRESETLSVYYRQTTYIPASPAEPDPEPLQTDTGSSSSPSNNTAAVLAALSAAVASSQSSKPNVIYETPTENSAALLSSLAASGSALNPGYNAYGTQQQQQQTTSFAGLYGSLAAYAQPLQYQQQYQAQYHPQQQQAPQQQAMVTPTLTNAMLAAERAKELLDMLQQTTQQQPGNQLQQQQEQQTSYYAAYQQTMQQQQQQQQRQQGQQQGQQQQAYGYAFYQSHQSQSTS